MRNKILILFLILIFIPIFSIYASDNKGNKIICPVCGAENPPNAKFCWRCGAPLKLKKKEIKKEKIPQKIAPTDSLMQTLKEIKELLKDVKEELKTTNMYLRPKIQEDTLKWETKQKKHYNPVIKEEQTNKIVGTVLTATGCLIILLMLTH